MHFTRFTTAILVSLFTVRSTFAQNKCYCDDDSAGTDRTYVTNWCCQVQSEITATDITWISDPNVAQGQCYSPTGTINSNLFTACCNLLAFSNYGSICS
ncbi:hypothetical protein PILCRDRAFT_819946 [Piloderma croceum F 1598]|uniref:Hydrophobin n=1 Tax=Piloderma croceum (strain F 1598) TaxID=765440 RepID=A0A0C3FFB9_PILCF|nr:hypothetical protein PILCRDRAFT_819946 [Piloderma croceum F 1598]